MNDLTTYNAYKGQMKTGDLLTWHHHTLFGKGISIRTGSKWNHSSLVIRLAEYEGLERRRYTTEALGKGVCLNLISRILESYAGEVWWYPLKDDWDPLRTGIGEKALSYVGVPYDFKSILYQLFGHVTSDDKAIFCSELCYLAWGFTGDAPSPGELVRLDIFKDRVRLI